MCSFQHRPFFLQVAGMIAKHKMKAKLITDVRDLWPESLLGVGVFTKKTILKLAFWYEEKLYHSSYQMIQIVPYFENT